MSVEIMREAGRINREAIEYGVKNALPGTTLAQLSDKIEAFIRKNGGTPAFKGYHGFPAAACLSLNDACVHGIPNGRGLVEGDILSIDVGTIVSGWYADAATTIIVGDDYEDHQVELIYGTRNILRAQMSVVKEGASLWDILVAGEEQAFKYSLHMIPDLGGHYIGQQLHVEPFIQNALDESPGNQLKNDLLRRKLQGHLLKENDTICLEPVATLGKTDIIVDADKWTCRTVDGSLTAHFEHMLLVTKDGYEILS